MKAQVKTYLTDTQYDIDGNVTFQRNFSIGEDLTDDDLQLIEDRSYTFYADIEDDYEDIYSTSSSQSWIAEELQYNPSDSFQIGNNMKGGI